MTAPKRLLLLAFVMGLQIPLIAQDPAARVVTGRVLSVSPRCCVTLSGITGVVTDIVIQRPSGGIVKVTILGGDTGTQRTELSHGHTRPRVGQQITVLVHVVGSRLMPDTTPDALAVTP